jgi:hypothetical protein
MNNSGQLKTFIYETAEQHHWPWEASLVYSPDKKLMNNRLITISTDSVILDNTPQWTNLGAHIVEEKISDKGPIIDLSSTPIASN